MRSRLHALLQSSKPVLRRVLAWLAGAWRKASAKCAEKGPDPSADPWHPWPF